jgi:hypothetical protein
MNDRTRTDRARPGKRSWRISSASVRHLDEWIIHALAVVFRDERAEEGVDRSSPMKVSVALFGVVLSTASPLPCFAGPCSAEIDAIMSRIDAGLEAVAAAGRGGAETAAATKHHQPTPKSIAEAEAKLGDVSTKLVDEVGNAMARARSADLAGDGAACEDALAVVRKGLER